jgi:hypothetical protein
MTHPCLYPIPVVIYGPSHQIEQINKPATNRHAWQESKL